MTHRVITIALTTSHVIRYSRSMPRWKEGARERLEKAALELFIEKGFGATTVPDIVHRAGLTTRTFFRHFPDKREVLFGNDAEIGERVIAFLTGAPAQEGEQALVTRLVTEMSLFFEGKRARLRERRAIVLSDGGLRERELGKLTHFAHAIEQGLHMRGVPARTAKIYASWCLAIFTTSLELWLDDASESPLADVLSAVIIQFASLTPRGSSGSD